MTAEYSQSYLYVAILGLTGIGFVLALLGASRLIQRRNPYAEKLTPYECGIPPFGDSRAPFAVRYYIFALLFVVFDVEALFLYPWAVVFRSLGGIGLVEMFVFIGVLLLGLFYAWAKGALEWA